MPHKDKYRNFHELEGYENPEAYGIVCEDRESNVLILAPHGGGIEPGTSEVARAIAGDDCSLYLFEGLKDCGNYDTLHITATRFDEPGCMNLLASAELPVAIHGCRGTDRQIFVGGLNGGLRYGLSQALRDAGYEAQAQDHRFPGENPRNTCNLGTGDGGLQLELTRGLRDDMNVQAFAKVVRRAIGADDRA